MPGFKAHHCQNEICTAASIRNSHIQPYGGSREQFDLVMADLMNLEHQNTAENAPARLVAVVTTYNRLAELQTTLASLLETAPEFLQAVVVVNNCSTDGTQNWLDAQQDPRVLVHHSDRNLGGAGGFEVGMRLAMQKFDPDWVVVMDDDARPRTGAFEQFASQPRDGTDVWAAAVYYPSGEICEMNRPSVNPFWRPKAFLKTCMGMFTGKGRDGYHIPYDSYDELKQRPLDMASFVGMFISRRVIQAMGYPEKALFLYGDDVIYSLRLRQQGFTMRFDPAVRFEHNCTTFANDQKRVFSPLWKVYYTYRNGLIMYHIAAGILFWPLLFLLVPKWVLASNRYGDQRKTYLRLTRRAVVDGLMGRKTLSHQEVLALAGENQDRIASQRLNRA